MQLIRGQICNRMHSVYESKALIKKVADYLKNMWQCASAVSPAKAAI